MKLDHLKKVNRLVIYFFYDKDGIVDRYVPYMLNDVKKNCSRLFVICNGKLTKEGRQTLERITPDVMVRENKGFDVWAYKTAMEYIGWEALSAYDELVLMNFTIYGPLYPLSEVFAEMNGKDLDFWGLTKHYKIPFNPYHTPGLDELPEHIQSSFICIRKKMLGSIEFRNYWDKMPPIENYADAVGRHEAIFTRTFNNCGFTSDVFVQTDDLEDYTRYPLMLKPKELIKNRKCPIFKKKMFSNEYYEYLDVSAGEAAVEAFRYISEHFDYDMDMVWENLLRTCNMADIKDRMHLNYVLSKDSIMYPQALRRQKTALFMHLYFDDLLDSSMAYADTMPEDSDIYFTVCSDKMQRLTQEASKRLAPRKVTIIRIENRGRDVSSLLIGAAPYVEQYDVACFAHDKKTTQNKPYTVGESFAYKCFENVLGSRAYVQNVIDRFEQEPRLGMLMPPTPNHSCFYDGVGGEWTINYEITRKLAEELDIHVDIDRNKEPIAPLGTMFWFRPRALKPLFNKKWKFEDFPQEPNKIDGTILHGIERLYGFAAQSQGYYEAWVMNDQFASIELTNLHFMTRELTKSLHYAEGYYGGVLGMVNRLQTMTVNPGAVVPIQPGAVMPLRLQLKRAIHKRVPEFIWVPMKKLYNLCGGKKWKG